MARHGKFDAVALLHRSGHTSVWSARPAGAAAATPNHCLKLVELSDLELADRDPTAAEDFLVGAALQQAMADKSEGWAPVYELGSDGTDAFYVTRLYPRSAQSMIDGRARLSSVDLRTILLAVVDGLADLESAYRRPHANLKPANVLVGEQVRPGQVHLSDPGAIAADVPSLTRAPDAKAVGQLLYALVTHRPHTGARWPLKTSDAWRSLGSSGRPWFELCASLVSPHADREPDLAELRERIAAVRTTRRPLPRALVAVPVLAAVAGAAYAYRHQIPQWYAAADRQVALLTRPAKPAHKPARGRVPLAATPHPTPGVADAAPKRVPAVVPPAVAPPAVAPPPSPPDLSATLAGLTAGPGADGPTVDVAPPPIVPPPPHVRLTEAPALTIPRPLGNPTAAPATSPALLAAAVDAAAAANRRALNLVADWSPPDFRSDSAQQAFEDGRKQFVAAHAGDDATVTLAQWEGVSTRLRLAGDAYPPVDVATTAGWPVAVADQVAARREQVLARAVAAAFDQQSFDPAPYHKLTDGVRAAVSAAGVARRAMAGGNVPAARASVEEFHAAVRQVAAADAGVADAMTASGADLDRLGAVESGTDRDHLLATADDESAPLAVRSDAWLRAGTVKGDGKGDKPWPADFAAAAADQARGAELAGLLHDQVATAAEHQLLAECDRRLAGYVASLRDQPAVAAAAGQAADPQYADLVGRCPAWFRFDAALAAARHTSAAAIRPGQRQRLLDLAAAAHAPAATDVADLLRTGDRRAAGTLATAGPAATGHWRLHAGSDRDRCTYDATDGTDQSVEFLRVHVPPTVTDSGTDPAGLDCYLGTTAAPVALMSHLLANDPDAVAAAKALGGPPPAAGPRVWRFDDADPTNPVAPDADGYRRAFGVPATDRLPAQRVTPPLALYLARRAGCRLPSPVEWRAALDAARHSADPVARGFATQGWKLRTAGDYAPLLGGDEAPDGGAFLPAGVDGSHSAVWSPAAAAKLGGRLAGDVPTPPDAWPLSTLETADVAGFRPVGGTDDYAGVFHDLVGNVAQFAVDVPAVMAEQIDAARPTAAADVAAWFTPDRLAAVAVVGGSAVSPPAVDPTRAYPLPAGPTAFSDVGFRLAFTDPAARPAEAWTALRRMPFATAP